MRGLIAQSGEACDRYIFDPEFGSCGRIGEAPSNSARSTTISVSHPAQRNLSVVASKALVLGDVRWQRPQTISTVCSSNRYLLKYDSCVSTWHLQQPVNTASRKPFSWTSSDSSFETPFPLATPDYLSPRNRFRLKPLRAAAFWSSGFNLQRCHLA
jgi:hypothetical protein